jgi:hypothetical protein
MSNIRAFGVFGVPKILSTAEFNLAINARLSFMQVLRRRGATLLTNTDAATIWFVIAILAIVLLAIVYDMP